MNQELGNGFMKMFNGWLYMWHRVSCLWNQIFLLQQPILKIYVLSVLKVNLWIWIYIYRELKIIESRKIINPCGAFEKGL